MFFLANHGETHFQDDPESLNEKGRMFQQMLSSHFTYAPWCTYQKGKHTCDDATVHGSCFCKKHFSDERKNVIRKGYEQYGLFIPKSRPQLDEIQRVLTEPWDEFSQVLTRDSVSVLNTLSLIVHIEATTTCFNLDKIQQHLSRCHDSVSFSAKSTATILNPTLLPPTTGDNEDLEENIDEEEEEDEEVSSRTSMGTAFNNVIEFVVIFESENSTTEKRELHNASVKLWRNNYIHICGCRQIQSALRVASSVIRSLREAQLLDATAIVAGVNPVFANASMDFFPYVLVIHCLQRPSFLTGIRSHLQDTDITVDIDIDMTGSQRTTAAIFCFHRPNSKYPTKPKTTTVKIYPRGNIIVTVNNFDGRMLQRALQSLQRTADEQEVYLHRLDRAIILDHPPGPVRTNVFSYTPSSTTIET